MAGGRACLTLRLRAALARMRFVGLRRWEVEGSDPRNSIIPIWRMWNYGQDSAEKMVLSGCCGVILTSKT